MGKNAVYDDHVCSKPARPKCSSQIASKSLEELCAKKVSTRENGLTKIIELFTVSYQHQFATQRFSTLLYYFLKCFKNKSSKESCLAADALGLLAITIGQGNESHELYRESIPILSDALKSESDPLKLKSIVHCLAIVTLVSASNSDEIEQSMLNIWQFVHSEPGPKGVGRKNSPAVQSAAIAAWSLLLSVMDGWALSHKHWQGAISFFLDLLEMAEEESIHVAAGEALALIFEVGFLKRFANGSEYSKGTSSNEEIHLLNNSLSEQELNEIVLTRMKSLSLQAKDEGGLSVSTKKKRRCNQDLLKMLKDGCFHETSVNIGKHVLTLNKWSKMVQLNYMKHVLGGGFITHMMGNEFLQDNFYFKPERQHWDREAYVCEREEVTVKLFLPEVRKSSICPQRLYKSPNSVYCKARTQLLNKNRDIKGRELWSEMEG